MIGIFGAAVLMSAGNAFAIVNADLRAVYQPIIERNPFGLRPPPPPATNTAPVKAEDPTADKKIYLTGLVTVGYPKIAKRAYLMTAEEKKKDSNVYYSLNEGQRSSDGEVEILQIDEKAQPAVVKVKWGGTETMLSFKTHGIAAPVATQPPAGGKPGAPGVPPGPGAPGAGPHNPAQAGYNHPGAAGAGVNGDGVPNTAGRQIPTRPVRMRGTETAAPVTPQPNAPEAFNPPPNQPVDPAQQYLRMRMQEEAAKQEGMFLPPTPPL